MHRILATAFALFIFAANSQPGHSATVQVDYAMPTVTTPGLFAPNATGTAPPLDRDSLTMSVTIDEEGYGTSLAGAAILFEHSYTSGISVNGTGLDGFDAADLAASGWQSPDWITFGDEFSPLWFSDASVYLSFDENRNVTDWDVTYYDTRGGPTGIVRPGFVDIVDYFSDEMTSLDPTAAAPPQAWTSLVTPGAGEFPSIAASTAANPALLVTPLPLSGLLMASGLFALGAAARRSRKSGDGTLQTA